ncbi:MAG: hypothetical protein RL500_1353, partial [Pseudomonadota bacterium]
MHDEAERSEGMKNQEFTLKPARVQDSGYSWRMTVRTRPVAALLAAFMLLGLSACGGGNDNKTAPAAVGVVTVTSGDVGL